MIRRLPVYLVIDCSYSMRGSPIQMVSEGVRRMLDDMRGDPFALETVWLSVISFSTGAQQDIPLTSVLEFCPPALACGGRTDLGCGLRLLAESIDREVRTSTAADKGDWKPTAFLLSDGGPSDGWIRPAKEIRSRHDTGRMAMIAVGFGKGVHYDKLRRVTSQCGTHDAGLTSSHEVPSGFILNRDAWKVQS